MAQSLHKAGLEGVDSSPKMEYASLVLLAPMVLVVEGCLVVKLREVYYSDKVNSEPSYI